MANHLYIKIWRKIITTWGRTRLWWFRKENKNGEKRRSVDSNPQPLKLRAKFFVVNPLKNSPFSSQKRKNYHIRKTHHFDFFFYYCLRLWSFFNLISFINYSRSMAYLFPLKTTQINIKIERKIVLIKPTSDNTLLIFFDFFPLISVFGWKLDLELWQLLTSARIISLGDITKKSLSKIHWKDKNQVFWQLFGERVEIDFFPKSKFVSFLKPSIPPPKKNFAKQTQR